MLQWLPSRSVCRAPPGRTGRRGSRADLAGSVVLAGGVGAAVTAWLGSTAGMAGVAATGALACLVAAEAGRARADGPPAPAVVARGALAAGLDDA